MLSWSSQQSETEIHLDVVARGRGDVGVPHSDELLRFATAAARLDNEPDELAELSEARQALISSAGGSAMIDAAAVAGNFQMMTRLADATGARYPQARLDAAASTIAMMGAADMVSRR